MKGLLIIICVFCGLFLLSMLVYFFNLDMKVAAKLAPILNKHYDNIERDCNL